MDCIVDWLIYRGWSQCFHSRSALWRHRFSGGKRIPPPNNGHCSPKKSFPEQSGGGRRKPRSNQIKFKFNGSSFLVAASWHPREDVGEDAKRKLLAWNCRLTEFDVQNGRWNGGWGWGWGEMYSVMMWLMQSLAEDEERRRIRRERNKLAAARCRQRRVDLTNQLLAVSFQ